MASFPDKAMAEAILTAEKLGWSFRWVDDWEIGSHIKFFGKDSYPEEPKTCECCELLDERGILLQACGCIDDADDDYRRVMESELAITAIYERNEALSNEAESAGDVPDVIAREAI